MLKENPSMIFNFVGTNNCGFPLANKIVHGQASLFTTKIDEDHPFEVAYAKDCWREATHEEKFKFILELDKYKSLVSNEIKSIRNILHDDKCRFAYKKKDGTIRHAYGTTEPRFVEEADNGRVRKILYCREDVIRYYDIDKKGWRSFLYKNFLGWE